MDSIIGMLTQQLGGDAVNQISRSLGTDAQSTQKAVAGALPLLVGILAKNTSKPEGAKALAGALSRDHDGSVFDNLGAVFGSGGSADGEGILRHALGERRGVAEQQLGGLSGLAQGEAGKLLAMLAPLVMGVLGRNMRSGNLDAGGLSDLLGREGRAAKKAAPAGAAGMLGSLLDADGDGDVMDDAARIGAGLLGKLFRK